MYAHARVYFHRFLQSLASIWFGAVLLVVLLVAMGFATVYESTHGTPRALSVFYGSSWFQALLALLGVNLIAAVVVRLPLRRHQIGFAITHTSLVIILVGAGVTALIGTNGSLPLFEGQSRSSFRGEREAIRLFDRSTGTEHSRVLPKRFGKLRTLDNALPEAVNRDGLRIDLVRYLPDAKSETAVVNDSPMSRHAVHLATAGGEPFWIFEGHASQAGISLTALPDAPSARNHANEVSSANHSRTSGSVVVMFAGETFLLDIERLGEPQPLGDSGFSASVLQIYAHAKVAAGGTVVDASPQPINPAARVEVSGPVGRIEKLAFAKFPDFESVLSSEGEIDVNIRYEPAGGGAATGAKGPGVELITWPGAEVLLALTIGADGTATSTDVPLGGAFTNPAYGSPVTLVAAFDHARTTESYSPVSPPREDRTPAILARVQRGESKPTDVWLVKHKPRMVAAGTAVVELVYTDEQIDLGFAVALDKFNLGYYPGGRRPRSFSSNVTVTDPETGLARQHLISMNHPLKFGGFTLFQSSYQMGGGKTMSVLSVAKDPGMPIVFTGYVLLLVGMSWTLSVRMRAAKQTEVAAATNSRKRVPIKISLLPEKTCGGLRRNGESAQPAQPASNSENGKSNSGKSNRGDRKTRITSEGR